MAKARTVRITTSTRRHGWRPDVPDQRDLSYAAKPAGAAGLPAKVDLKERCPPVLEQGELGACTACALASAHRFCQRHQPGGVEFAPSRLFIYWNERELEGSTGADAGATLRNGLKTLAAQGVCPEDAWPYQARLATRKPSAAAFRAALRHQALNYRRLSRDPAQFKGCLASGFPFLFGIAVYESFESDGVRRSGVVPMPKANERCKGGHALLATGYDERRKVFFFQNSWGEDWGVGGFGTIPYAYLAGEGLSGDFWTLRLIEE